MSGIEPLVGQSDDGIEPGVLRYDLLMVGQSGLPAGHTVATSAATAVRRFIAAAPKGATVATVVVDFTDPRGPVSYVSGYGPEPTE